MCSDSEAFARVISPGLGYDVAGAVLLAAPTGVMIISTNSRRWPSRTNSSIWSRNCIQSFVSWPTSFWKLQYLFWFLRARSVRSDGGSRSSLQPDTSFRTCLMVATSRVYWRNLPTDVLKPGEASTLLASVLNPFPFSGRLWSAMFSFNFFPGIRDCSRAIKPHPLIYSSTSVCFQAIPLKYTNVGGTS